MKSVLPELWDHVLALLLHHDLRYSKKTGTLHEYEVPAITCWVSSCLYHDCIIETTFLGNERYYVMAPFRCQICSNSHLTLDDHEDLYVCALCGEVGSRFESHMSSYIDSHGPSLPQRYEQRLPRQHTLSCYKRINHFRNVLLRIQAKEELTISEENYNRIQQQLQYRYAYTLPTQYTYANVKYCLKALGLQSYYNHIFSLILKFSGRRLVNLTNEQTTTMVQMFISIQQPFAECRDRRVNMFSYLYLIRKFSELRGWIKLSRSLPLLKSRSKIRQQDVIWYRICQKMGFDYTPSTI
jgi:hypothetical protein